MIKFSVLGCVYFGDKSEEFNLSLKSIADQTLMPNEVVLVVDGLVDNKINNVINFYKKKIPLKVVRLKKNMGLGFALQIGLNKCSNEYVFRFDADDINRKYRFKKQIDFLIKNKNVDILSGHIEEFKYKPGDLGVVRKSTIGIKNIKEIIYWKNPINHVSTVFKKSSILSVGGYIHHYGMEDYKLWIRSISSNLIIESIDDILVDVRVDSLTERRRGLKHFKPELKLFSMKVNYLKGRLITNVFVLFLRLFYRIIPIFAMNILYKFILRNGKK